MAYNLNKTQLQVVRLKHQKKRREFGRAFVFNE